MLSNLIDEEAGSPNHPELWLKFAEGLGVSDVAVRSTEKTPETKNLIDTFRSVCGDGSIAEGLAALYAYESQIPAICESKIDGLKKYYGFNNPEHYRYFTVHIVADREHSAAERSMLGAYVKSRSRRTLGDALRRLPPSRDRVIFPTREDRANAVARREMNASDAGKPTGLAAGWDRARWRFCCNPRPM